jgi:hypothetical protein
MAGVIRRLLITLQSRISAVRFDYERAAVEESVGLIPGFDLSAV